MIQNKVRRFRPAKTSILVIVLLCQLGLNPCPAHLGKCRQYVAHYQQVLQIKPDHHEAANNLKRALVIQQKTESKQNLVGYEPILILEITPIVCEVDYIRFES